MRQYIIRRVLQSIPILIGISILIFFIVHAAPGSPASKMMDPKMTAAEKARIEAKLGLDKPVYVQYVNWASEVLKGNMGYSTKFSKPVTQVIQERMWNTFYLALFALIISLVIGIPIGILSATKQYSIFDYIMTVVALFGLSIPAFFFALIMIKVFAIDLGWFPASGMVTPGKPFSILDVIHHAIMPGFVLGMLNSATFMRFMRSSMLEVIRQDYIRTARAKGLKEKIVIYKHALRNSLIPVITLLGFSIPGLFSGALLTETVFGWPGMGMVGLMAINDRDYPLLMGVNLFLAILTLLGNLLADIFYGFADPRIRY